jgi:hypothetical protein
MSTVYNPEADLIAEIEKLEIDARNLRRSMEKATHAEDKRVLERQLKEVESRVDVLRKRLP